MFRPLCLWLTAILVSGDEDGESVALLQMQNGKIETAKHLVDKLVDLSNEGEVSVDAAVEKWKAASVAGSPSLLQRAMERSNEDTRSQLEKQMSGKGSPPKRRSKTFKWPHGYGKDKKPKDFPRICNYYMHMKRTTPESEKAEDDCHYLLEQDALRVEATKKRGEINDKFLLYNDLLEQLGAAKMGARALTEPPNMWYNMKDMYDDVRGIEGNCTSATWSEHWESEDSTGWMPRLVCKAKTKPTCLEEIEALLKYEDILKCPPPEAQSTDTTSHKFIDLKTGCGCLADDEKKFHLSHDEVYPGSKVPYVCDGPEDIKKTCTKFIDDEKKKEKKKKKSR